MNKRLQIFRSGTHTAMSGREITFTDADVADMAASYDPDVYQAPLVRGHPQDNKPAAGWVGALHAENGLLEADPSRVEVDLVEDVRAERFKYISASIYMPDSPNNPKPGHHYVRHVGFLGAAPPAVKGLKPAEFVEAMGMSAEQFSELEESGEVCFQSPTGELVYHASTMSRVAQGLRDFLLANFGKDQADSVVSPMDLEALRESTRRAADAEDPDHNPAAVGAAFNEPTEGNPMTTENTDFAEQQAALDARQRELDEREQAIKAEGERIAKEQADRVAADCAAFTDELVQSGRVTPALRDATAAALVAIEGLEGEVSFSEGDETRTVSHAAHIRSLLKNSGPQLEFGERSGAASAYVPQAGETRLPEFGDAPVDPEAAELDRKVMALSQEKNISYDQALQRLTQ